MTQIETGVSVAARRSNRTIPWRVERVVAAPGENEAATFNGSSFIVGDKQIAFYRVNGNEPVQGMPDMTDVLRAYSMVPAVPSVVGEYFENGALPEGIINLEDLRCFVCTNGRSLPQLLIGATAVVEGNRPRVAIIKCENPLSDKLKFSKPEVLQEVPDGKNTCFNSEDCFSIARKGEAHNKSLSVVRKHRGIWKVENVIQFPENLPWANWRIGLTGSEWVSLQRDGDYILGRKIIHGVNKGQNPRDDEYKYSLGMALFGWKRDFEDMQLHAVGWDPVLTYDQMRQAYKAKFKGKNFPPKLNPRKKVVYSCDGGMRFGNNYHQLVTCEDTEGVEMSVPYVSLLHFPLQPVNPRSPLILH